MGSDLLEVYVVLAALSMVIRDAARLALVTLVTRRGMWGASLAGHEVLMDHGRLKRSLARLMT